MQVSGYGSAAQFLLKTDSPSCEHSISNFSACTLSIQMPNPPLSQWFVSIISSATTAVPYTLTSSFYNAPNITCDRAFGHCYQLVIVPGGITFAAAKAIALQNQYKGMQGYLPTSTNAIEQNRIINILNGMNSRNCDIWLGAASQQGGYYQWISGPEQGQYLGGQSLNISPGQASPYSGWCSSSSQTSGDAVAINTLSFKQCWNAINPVSLACGYLIEYGTSNIIGVFSEECC